MRFSLVMVLVLAGCTDDGVVNPGRLEVQGITHYDVPDSIFVGEYFTLDVETFGSSCNSAASTDVVMSTEGATVSVFDYERTTGTCLANIMPIEHDAIMRFDSIGTKTITVRGWDVGQNDFAFPVIITVK